ncbi:hypothetical protein DY023_14710 [Microbacterium bovistercoris]|uniref:Lipoprotein n=1 Tax=Microbacterium bovistercoris TaxID=2293570 RepID=A0A371NST7_9MICO|nr:hypothetical protein [Microbacterium bovistercoris]REJ04675.1 hypothetical protein DY023_14710 [Microbacterium bovistercoris]
MTSSRILPVLATAVLALGLLAGCTPAPEPKPTKTAAFASDEEAFAAAEETYEAYIGALNQTDLADTDTFGPVFTLLRNPALASEKKGLSTYHAEHLTRTGDSSFTSFTPLSFDGEKVLANLCLDVSAVEMTRESGESIVPDDRLNVKPLEVTFVEADTSTGLAISSNIRAEGFQCDQP